MKKLIVMVTMMIATMAFAVPCFAQEVERVKDDQEIIIIIDDPDPWEPVFPVDPYRPIIVPDVPLIGVVEVPVQMTAEEREAEIDAAIAQEALDKTNAEIAQSVDTKNEEIADYDLTADIDGETDMTEALTKVLKKKPTLVTDRTGGINDTLFANLTNQIRRMLFQSNPFYN